MTIIHKKEDFLFEPGDIVVSELSGIDKLYIYDLVVGSDYHVVNIMYHIVNIMFGKSKSNF